MPLSLEYDGLRLESTSLGDVLRQAFEIHGAAQVKRCVGYRGVWYAWI